MDMDTWHTRLPGNEFDYLALMGALKDYKRPRDKVTALLRRGDIIRIKKGIYTLGPHLRKGPVSREVLGNLIHGPSYLSLEYALFVHQLIPERAETVTSVTMHKTKAFVTPLGPFSYRHVKTPYYTVGQRLDLLPDQRGFVLACPEKAVADKVYFSRGLKRLADLDAYLFADLRMEREDFSRLDAAVFQELSAIEGRRTLNLLLELARAYQ
jgi:hypothetical protein